MVKIDFTLLPCASLYTASPETYKLALSSILSELTTTESLILCSSNLPSLFLGEIM
ncbi:MAG: hypothetical protein RRA63_09335 [Candidatus Calescibacterium sp.]|nr:hypothetical protein [Candidatus Calescibacterium sp.]